MLSPLISLTLTACCMAAFSNSGLQDSAKIKAAFNAAKGKVRIVMIVSPTCPVCVSGADLIRTEVVGKLKSTSVEAFAVFIPMLPADGKAQAIEGSQKMASLGIHSFWDGNRSLGNAFGETVKLPNGNKTAWDVYFVYGPDAAWEKTPPKPSFWMHQLAEDDRCLDPSKFRNAVEKQLKAMKGRSSPKLELLMFEGCPNSPKMVANLKTALKSLGITQTIKVVNLLRLDVNDVRRGYGAPTVLVNGKDLFGQSQPKDGENAASCRLYPGGVPTVSEIATRLKAAEAPLLSRAQACSTPSVHKS